MWHEKYQISDWVQWLTLVIPAVQEAEIVSITFQGQSGQKLARPRLNQQAGMVVHTCGPSYSGG
jgi:hypothetical protein